VTGDPDGLAILEKLSEFPSARIRYIPDADPDSIPSVGPCLVFLMAFWSGPSVRGFSNLTKALNDIGTDDLELVVVDVDGSPDLYQLPEIKALFGEVVRSPRGVGEVAFCRDGQPVRAAIIGSDDRPRDYESSAKEFLSSCGIG